MSDITNVVAKQKALYHTAGANASAVESAVESLNDMVVVTRIGDETNADCVNSTHNIVAPFACDLQACYFTPSFAIANTAADEILVTVSCNGDAACSYNSNASADGALAANTPANMTLTESNVALAAGEVLDITYTAEDPTNNSPLGVVTALLRRK